MLRLILKENSYQFNEKNYLQIHGISMVTKIAITFASIFIANIKTENIYKFKSCLHAKGYPKRQIETLLSNIKFRGRNATLN